MNLAAIHSTDSRITFVSKNFENRSNNSNSTNSCCKIQIMNCIATLNNTGINLIKSSKLSQAYDYLQESLNKAINEDETTKVELFSSFPSPMMKEQQKLSSFSQSESKLFIKEIEFSEEEENQLSQKDSYDEGMNTFSHSITMNTNNSSILFPTIAVHQSAALATIIFNLGILCVRMNKKSEAYKYFYRALTTASKSGKYGTIIVFRSLHNMGYIQYFAGRYEDALGTYNKALELLQKSNNMMLETAAILNCLGVVSFHYLKDPTNSTMLYFQESLSLRRKFSAIVPLSRNSCDENNNSREIATVLNNIGRMYYERGDYENALEMYAISLNMRREILDNDHIDVAATVYNTGQSYHQMGELSKAMQLYEQFLSIAKMRLGAQHRDVANILQYIAEIHHNRGNINDAIKTQRESIQVGKNALGEYHPKIASALNKLGNLLFENGNLDDAIIVYKQGLEIERFTHGLFHQNTIVTIINIGQIHKAREDYRAALHSYKEVLEIQRHRHHNHHEEGFSPSPLQISNTLSTIAMMYYQIQDYFMSLNAYQEALQIRREIHGTDNRLEVASSLNSIGLVLYKLELYDYALQSFNEGCHIRKQLLGPDHSDIAKILYNIATVLLETGDDDDALMHYRETLRIESIEAPDDDIILTMQHIAHIHQQRGEYDDALFYFMKSLAVQQKNQQNQNQNQQKSTNNYTAAATGIARTLNHIGNLYLRRGTTKQMMNAFSQSARYLNADNSREKDFYNELIITGLAFYSISKKHPECSPAA